MGVSQREYELSELPEPARSPASTVLTLNMYVVSHGLGIPPYTRTYIWVDLKDFDAWDGTQGRYVLVGWAEPNEFRAIATILLHWPAEQGVTHIERDGAAEMRATLRVGDADLIVARASRAEGAVGTEFANLTLCQTFSTLPQQIGFPGTVDALRRVLSSALSR